MVRVNDSYKFVRMGEFISRGFIGCGLWREVWKLKVLFKIGVFMWRYLWEIFRMGKALRRERVEVNGGCVRCGERE